MGRRPPADALWEARIADLKEAHAREVGQLHKVIDVLAEQVEYLRATTGRAQPLRQPTAVEAMQAAQPWVSEEEEDLRAMSENGLISESDLKAALDELGIEH